MDAADELEALWSDVFGEPPPIRARAEELSQALVAHLPPAPAYTPAPPSFPAQAREDAGNSPA